MRSRQLRVVNALIHSSLVNPVLPSKWRKWFTHYELKLTVFADGKEPGTSSMLICHTPAMPFLLTDDTSLKFSTVDIALAIASASLGFVHLRTNVCLIWM